MIVAFLQHGPELVVRILLIAGHVLRRHPEREGLDLERSLAALERFAREGVDLLDLLVRHRVAAGRRAGPVHHQVLAGAPMGPVIAVREADVERQVIAGARVHLVGVHRVEPLRSLPVAFGELGSELARPFADVVARSEPETAVVLLLPDLEDGFFLEDADHDRRLGRHALCPHLLQQFRREPLLRLRRDVLERLVAARKQQRARDHARAREPRHGPALQLHCAFEPVATSIPEPPVPCPILPQSGRFCGKLKAVPQTATGCGRSPGTFPGDVRDNPCSTGRDRRNLRRSGRRCAGSPPRRRDGRRRAAPARSRR